MNRLKFILVATAAVAALTTSAVVFNSLASAAPATETAMPTSAAEHAAEAAKYDQEALELDQKAKRHEEMAKGYQARYSGGSKQGPELLSLVEHCKRLAHIYAEAAAEARETAKSHRQMAQSM